jgi:hypothetical protein
MRLYQVQFYEIQHTVTSLFRNAHGIEFGQIVILSLFMMSKRFPPIPRWRR